MGLKKWNNIPDNLKNEKTRAYYDILSKKTCSLFIKRLLDILISALLLVLTSPVLLILGIAIKIESEGPVFYRQERITQ